MIVVQNLYSWCLHADEKLIISDFFVVAKGHFHKICKEFPPSKAVLVALGPIIKILTIQS